MKERSMKRNIITSLVLGSALVFGACTDLEVKETDSIVTAPEGDFKGVDAAGNLTAAYNALALQNTQENLYALSEATTDELFIPTRGTDWGDNGVWRDLAKHTWNSSHQFNLNTWNFLNSTVYGTNQILHPATTKTPLQEAEAKFIRAYFMFWILDLWRQVPFRNADEGPEVNPTILGPQEAFDFIVGDLEAALPVLPSVKSGEIDKQIKASQAAANMMLAKLYLNKSVYLSAPVNNADMDKVIGYITAIEADGYKLQKGFFEIFSPSADSETILYSNGKYDSRIWGSLHYNQGRETDNKNGGWNGFVTPAEFYSKFEGPADVNPVGGTQEERRGYVPDESLGIGFLIGTQGGPGGPVKARSGQNLVFTKNVTSLTGQPDYSGIRLLKYHPTINMPGSNANHLMLLRYSDALLMKAEALFRKGSAAEALTLVNSLRTIRGASALGSLTEDAILDERGRELYIEGWRRNDMVRFGKFAAQFVFVEDASPDRNVFPIPDVALGSNPNLKQNAGY
jgi:hypothetical protein